MRLYLPDAAALDDQPRRVDLDEGRVGPGVAAATGRLDPVAGAGAGAVGVLARQVPVDQEVVGELRVVGDVGEVLEDLLARTGDDRLRR